MPVRVSAPGAPPREPIANRPQELKALVDAMLVWLLTGEVDADQVRLAVEGE